MSWVELYTCPRCHSFFAHLPLRLHPEILFLRLRARTRSAPQISCAFPESRISKHPWILFPQIPPWSRAKVTSAFEPNLIPHSVLMFGNCLALFGGLASCLEETYAPTRQFRAKWPYPSEPGDCGRSVQWTVWFGSTQSISHELLPNQLRPVKVPSIMFNFNLLWPVCKSMIFLPLAEAGFSVRWLCVFVCSKSFVACYLPNPVFQLTLFCLQKSTTICKKEFFVTCRSGK